MGRVAGHRLIVVAGVVVASEALPVLGHDLGDAAAAFRQDLQPEQHGPEAVFLTDVIAAGAEALFTAEGDATGIEQVAEELPTRGGLVALDPQLLGHHINGCTGGHRSRHTRQAGGVSRHHRRIGREHGQAVAGIHEALVAQNHVAVAIAIAGGTEAMGITVEQQIGQLVGIGEVRVGMTTAEVLEGDAVAHAAGRSTQQTLEHAAGVGTGDGVHGVEGQREIAADQIGDAIEIEQLLHQRHEVIDAVDHLHLHRTDAEAAGSIDGDRRRFEDRVLLKGLGALEHRVGEAGRRRPAVGTVHLHAEVPIRAAGVVACREDDAADGLTLADQVGGRGGGKDAAGGDDHLAEAMGGPHAQDHVDGTTVAVAAVAPQHQGSPLHTGEGAEHGLHEALEVVRRFELLAALAQSGRAGLLIGEGSVQAHLTLRRFHRGRGGHHEEWDYAERKHGMTVAA